MITIKSILRLVRVRQWYKNLLVLIPLLFGNLLFNTNAVSAEIIAFLTFCAVSGIVYTLNDIRDREKDVYHPEKLNRPLVAGEISLLQAWLIILILTLLVITGLHFLPSLILLIIIFYVIQNVAYSLWLKNVAIVDVLIIGVGFVLRVVAGCIAVDIILSPWLFTETFLLALLLGFSKRLYEKGIITNVMNHRPVLGDYHPKILQAYLIISATSVLMVYLIYAITGAHSPYFVLTIPFAMYGIFSFLSKSLILGMDPDNLLKNAGFVANLLLWLAVVVLILYGF